MSVVSASYDSFKSNEVRPPAWDLLGARASCPSPAAVEAASSSSPSPRGAPCAASTAAGDGQDARAPRRAGRYGTPIFNLTESYEALTTCTLHLRLSLTAGMRHHRPQIF